MPAFESFKAGEFCAILLGWVRKMAVYRSSLVFGLCGLAFLAANALAENDVLQLAAGTSLYEAYLESPPPLTRGATVGAAIIGIRLADESSSFNPEEIRAQLGRERPEQLCLKIISRDGRYFARARYRTEGVSAEAPRLAFQSSYGQKLESYGSSDIAVSLMAASKVCDERGNRAFVATALGPKSSRQRLLVQLRAGDARVRAQLGKDNVALGSPVLCEKTPAPAIAFTHQCALDLPAPLAPSTYQLSIGETGARGEINVKTYAVVLSAGSQ
jgi:hypothetical protein